MTFEENLKQDVIEQENNNIDNISSSWIVISYLQKR